MKHRQEGAGARRGACCVTWPSSCISQQQNPQRHPQAPPHAGSRQQADPPVQQGSGPAVPAAPCRPQPFTCSSLQSQGRPPMKSLWGESWTTVFTTSRLCSCGAKERMGVPAVGRYARHRAGGRLRTPVMHTLQPSQLLCCLPLRRHSTCSAGAGAWGHADQQSNTRLTHVHGWVGVGGAQHQRQRDVVVVGPPDLRQTVGDGMKGRRCWWGATVAAE